MSAVTATMVADLIEDRPAPGEEPIHLLTCWEFHRQLPFEVAIGFRQGRTKGWVNWDIGRELLVEGVSNYAGEGDVRVWPVGADVLIMQLSSPSGTAKFGFLRREVQEFLTRVAEALGDGADEIDWDDVVERLLS